MIREIINFTNDLLADIPEIINWNELPDKGIHIFIDINKKGEWTNRNLKRGIDFDYFGESATNSKLEEECIRFQDASRPIVMNKAIDTNKQIHSCSPFSVSYKMKWNGISKTEKEKFGILTFKKEDHPNKDEIRQNNERFLRVRNQMIRDKVESYKKAALSKYHINDVILIPGKESFPYISQLNGFYSHMDEIMDAVETLPIYDYNLNNDDYVHIYLRTVPKEVQEKMYERYVEENIFIKEDLCIGNFGPIDFDTAYNSKKPLIRHLTSSLIGGVNQRFPKEDAVAMHKFEILCKNGTLPNPLPIVVDNSEVNNNSEVNSSIVRLWNRNGEKRSFPNLINDLFRSSKFTVLPDFYLLHLAPTSNGSFVADDFDFVPIFRYNMPKDFCIYNATGIKTGFWSKELIDIKTIFDFERIIIREIFNNKLVNITKDGYKSYYFGKIKLPKGVIPGGLNIILDLIFRYRKSIYDFIYKSDRKSITGIMFDNIMLESILSNIKDDEVKYNYASIDYGIKVKLNIWFSLYNFFNIQHKFLPNMATKVSEILEWTKMVAKGEGHIENAEEFAFAAGQIVSYLIDCSEASHKTYSMLEPFLQKSTTNQIQDAIAGYISVYKHKIYVANFKFKNLAAEVLADERNTAMKPLLKFFLAGCFCKCVIYNSAEKPQAETEDNDSTE